MKDSLGEFVLKEKLEIDCLQNILISLCKYKDVIGFVPGAVWPWKYTIFEHNNKIEIENSDIVGFSYLKEMYDINCKFSKFDKDKKNKDTFLKILNNNKDYVILGVDQYYLSYQPGAIYKKKHGKHTLILEKGIIDNKVICISSIPKFVGLIDLNDLVQAFTSPFIESWIVNVEMDGANTYPEKKHFLECFKKSFDNKIIYDEYGRVKKEICTVSLYNLFETMSKNNQLDCFCENSWGWKMANRSQSLNYFISHISNDIELVQKVKAQGKKIDDMWKILFRKIYAGSIAASHNHLTNINSLFKNVIEYENFLRILLEKEFLN